MKSSMASIKYLKSKAATKDSIPHIAIPVKGGGDGLVTISNKVADWGMGSIGPASKNISIAEAFDALEKAGLKVTSITSNSHYDQFPTVEFSTVILGDAPDINKLFSALQAWQVNKKWV